MIRKLGKKPARFGAIPLSLADYVHRDAVAAVPADFGHERLVAAEGWDELGNDMYGCCFWAGSAHETMMWNYERGVQAAFSTTGVLSDYAAATGFSIKDPNSDQGTDMEQGAKYRKTTGIVDCHGVRHKIDDYLAIKAADLDLHAYAAYHFGAVGIGFYDVPTYAMHQFDNHQPWSLLPNNQKPNGGHYVPYVARRKGNIAIVTWGRLQWVTPAYFAHYNDESVVYLSSEMLKGGKSPEGFDLAALKTDLASLG